MKIVREGAIGILIMTLALSFLGTDIVSADVPKTIKKKSGPDHGVLELSVPTFWKVKIHKAQENMPPTIIIKPALRNDFEVLITSKDSPSLREAFAMLLEAKQSEK